MRRHPLVTVIAVFLAIAGVLLLSACRSAESDLPEPENPNSEAVPSSSNDASGLECQVEGFPCSYAEAETQVLERSAAALDAAALVLDESESIEAAAAVLQEHSDLAEILYAPEGIRFRLEGGPPMWLINGAAIASGSKAPGNGSREAVPMPATQFSLTGRSTLQEGGPIGGSEPGKEPFKKALILSPFWWEFGGDETEELASFLRQVHRNYDCDDCEVHWKINNVQKRQEGESVENYELTKTLSLDYGVSLTDYANWDEYDLIHISTHGLQLCQDGQCRGFLMTGRFVNKPEWSQTGVPDFDIPGIVWGRTAVPGCGALDGQMGSGSLSDEEWDAAYAEWLKKGCGTFSDRWWQFAGPDFFTDTYSQPGRSMDNKLIFLNSCQSMKDLSLAESVAGDNTTVLGWTEVVSVDPAGQVSLIFYDLYVKKGLRANIAFDQVKEEMGERFQADLLRRFKPKGIEIESLLPPEFISDGGQDTRGREIITLMQPIYRVELEEQDAIPTLGIPGDGEHDEILLLVQIDGIDESQKPGEFEVHFAINGEKLEKTIKPQEKIGDYSYWALGILPMPFDSGEQALIKLEAWVELPEGGQSRHVLEEVQLANCGWLASLSGGIGGEIKGDITFPTATLSAATAEQLARLAGEGYLGPSDTNGSNTPSANELANLPESYMLGNQEELPFIMIIPGYGANMMLERNSLAFGSLVSIQHTKDDSERKEGSFSVGLQDMLSQQYFNVEGKFVWHIHSLCSMDVIVELGSNPYPESMIPPGFLE